jgi:hypothetical protein
MALGSLAVLALLLRIGSPPTPAKASIDTPSVTIALPNGVHSEVVQIRYFMSGSFGGYGGYVKSERGLTSYRIEAENEGRRADAIRVLIYAPGCKILKLELKFSGAENLSEQFTCETLPTVRLSGQIPADLLQDPEADSNPAPIAARFQKLESHCTWPGG